MTAAKPIRLRLSRLGNFNLQRASLVANGLQAVNVARPGKWGNPFNWQEAREEYGCAEVDAKKWAVDTYCQLCTLALGDNPNRETSIFGFEELKIFIRENIHTLKGKNLACWCKPGEPCHAELLLKLANDDAEGGPQ
jgi:hypothetical protein